mgnify:FL=1
MLTLGTSILDRNGNRNILEVLYDLLLGRHVLLHQTDYFLHLLDTLAIIRFGLWQHILLLVLESQEMRFREFGLTMNTTLLIDSDLGHFLLDDVAIALPLQFILIVFVVELALRSIDFHCLARILIKQSVVFGTPWHYRSELVSNLVSMSRVKSVKCI